MAKNYGSDSKSSSSSKPAKAKRVRKNALSDREWTRWWDLRPEDLAQGLTDRARALWDDDSTRREDLEINLGRFGLTLSGLYLDNSVRQPEAMRLNLTKSLTETITAKIGKNRPRPLVLTDDGKWVLKNRAKKLQRFLDAVYGNVEVYAKAPSVFRNSMLMGTGALYVSGCPSRSKFELENVFPLELLVDNTMASRGEAFTPELLRVYPDDKDRLISLFPEHADAIENAPVFGMDNEAPLGTLGRGVPNRDLRTCMVVEGWYKARYTAKGELVCGRHALVVNGAVLVDEEWEHPSFPFVFHHWSEPARGFWGASAVAEIRGLEREANVNLQRGQDALRRGGMPVVMSPATAEVQEKKFTNEPMIHVTYEGQIKPEIVLIPGAHPQILEQPDRLSRMAANQLGTNELQMSASKPAGVESGRALEQLSEEHAVRFDTVSKSFERALSKELAIQLVRVARDMDAWRKDNGHPQGLRLQSTYKREYIDLNWSEVSLGPDELFIDVFPVSVLPHLPAARTAEVERWQANKWITDDQAKSLLDFPDLESVASVSRADFDLLEWQLSQMLDEGEPTVPNKRQNLDQARSYGTHALLKAVRENYPAENIALLEDFLAVIDEWLDPPAADPNVNAPPPDMAAPPLPADPMAAGAGATAPLADPMMAALAGGGMPAGGMPPVM